MKVNSSFSNPNFGARIPLNHALEFATRNYLLRDSSEMITSRRAAIADLLELPPEKIKECGQFLPEFLVHNFLGSSIGEYLSRRIPKLRDPMIVKQLKKFKSENPNVRLRETKKFLKQFESEFGGDVLEINLTKDEINRIKAASIILDPQENLLVREMQSASV